MSVVSSWFEISLRDTVTADVSREIGPEVGVSGGSGGSRGWAMTQQSDRMRVPRLPHEGPAPNTSLPYGQSQGGVSDWCPRMTDSIHG